MAAQQALPLELGPHWRRREILRHGRRSGEFAVRWLLRLGLPLVCVTAAMRLFPYRGSAADVPFRVNTTLFRRPGVSLDTTIGNWEFPNVDGLPLGVHVLPENVNVLSLTAANQDMAAFASELRDEVERQVPYIAAWVVGQVLIGVLVGLALAAGINMAVRYLRGLPVRPHEVRLRVRQLSAAGLVLTVLAIFGVATYEEDWSRESRTTGTLGAMQLFPDQLARYYTQQSKAFDVLGAIVGIQASLQEQIEAPGSPETALSIMYISDMHLAATYPLVAQYAQNFGVDLIVNTGDESAFGSEVEMTASYRAAISSLTARVPMIWMAGNHDSPATEATMRSIPGVIVLGRKSRVADGFEVTGGQVTAFGLRILAVPDPRVYGGPGVFGEDDESKTDEIERAAVDSVLARLGETEAFDIAASHEPVAANRLREKLGDRVRQTNAGHTHKQNSDLREDDVITLEEGSTGAGGLDQLNRDQPPPPVEFSIESVAADCQFTKIIRFRLPTARAGERPEAALGTDVTASTTYFPPQQPTGRTCGTSLGMGQPTLV